MKKQTYDEIKQELIEEIKSLPEDVSASDIQYFAHMLRQYTEKMVKAAINKFDAQAKHYMQVGEAAENFFNSMRYKK